ncbi:MAG TPA: hypothetical protein PKY87_17475 [Terricaulis sp.]|nr:hypothetical protein [Terricaulis sp.]
MFVSRSAPPRRILIDLGRGATAHARALTAFELRTVAAEARAEWTRLREGEPTQRTWASINSATRAAMREDDGLANQVFDWMHAVLTATASVERLDGVDECDMDADGAPINLRPMQASFEAFELLFLDGEVEVRFRLNSPSLERVWAEEKNVYASAPNGSGAEAENFATGAPPSVTTAPEAESIEISPTDPPALAQSEATPPEPPKESLHGTSPTPAPGNSPEA